METRFRTYDKEHPTGLTEFQYTSLLVGAVCQSMYCVSGKGSDGVLIVLGLIPACQNMYCVSGKGSDGVLIVLGLSPVCQNMYCVSGKGSDGVLIVLGLSPVYAQTYDGSRVSWL